MRYIIFILFFSPFLAMSASFKDIETASPSNKIKKIEVKSLSDLQRLNPAESISVLQKRYLPKTFRFEFNLSSLATINHTFFHLGGVSSRIGFFIREDHGFGVEGMALLSPIFKAVTNEMIGAPNFILPYNVVLPQFYGGAYYKWTPVFGKFALLNRRIIYFDTYMTLGGGVNKLLDGVQEIRNQIAKKGLKLSNEGVGLSLPKPYFPALSFGFGQMFSITQDWAFNWELKLIYNFVQYNNDQVYTPTDINLSLGMNYYFPGASYR